jgi:preprotein translocase subunit SecB|tara:strand:+ start:728 stop:1156 length:429 start_codon:yes stop_codon:yes gene_type:complete
MIMTEKFKVLAKFIKDMSVETPDVETYLFVKECIQKYKLNIDIKTKPLKNKLIEIDITFIFEDKEANEKKAFFEITYAVITKINDDIKDKKELEKIILCDVPTSVYPDIEKTFLSLVHNSGYPALNFQKKVDFNKLFNERFN